MTEPMPLRLHPEDRKAIVVELAAILQKRTVRASTLAKLYDVSADWVYDHKEELGGRYIGDKKRKSDKTRIVFDLATADAWMASRSVAEVDGRRQSSRGGRQHSTRGHAGQRSVASFTPVVPLPAD